MRIDVVSGVLNKSIHFHLFRHSSATYYASKLNRQELCYRYGWKFSSNMPDTYISRAGMESKELDEKFQATLRSKYKKLDFIFFSDKASQLEIKELKKRIFESFPIIRVYTKEPGKAPTKDPMILKKDSNIKEAAEKIRKGFSKQIKTSRIWGPSSKFGGQTTGLDHTLKDKDTIEFHTK